MTIFNRHILTILLALFSLASMAQNDILRFDYINNENGLSQNTVMGIVKDKYGFMWFGTWDGLCRYDGYEMKIYKHEANNPKSLPNNRVLMLHSDKNGDIWVACLDTLIQKYNYLTDNFDRYKAKEVPSFILDSLDRFKNISFGYIERYPYIWHVNQMNNKRTLKRHINYIDNALYQVNINTKTSYKYTFDPFYKWSINDDYVFGIYIDDNDIFWAGTYSGGVNKADLRQKPFRYYYHHFKNNQSIINDKIRAFCMDDYGNVWVGTHEDGLTIINRKTNSYKHFQFDVNNPKGSLINNQIRKLYKDRFGYMWVATRNGIDRIDPKSYHIEHYYFSLTRPVSYSWVYDITEDHNGYLWIATWGGIAKFNRKTNKFLIVNSDSLFVRRTCRVIFEDSKYNLWVGSEGGGLIGITRDSSSGFNEHLTSKHFRNSATDTTTLSSNHIYCVAEDANGFFWVGTNEGLNKFDPRTGKCIRFFVKNGLVDEVIMGILPDKKGNIWISHKKGISRLDIKTYSIRHFNKRDGLQDDEFSEGAYYQNSQTGEMFFGGVKGFNTFFPDSIKDNPFPPKVVLTNLYISNNKVEMNKTVNGRIILNAPLYLSKEITLTYNEPLFSFEFAALHFLDPQRNRYAYKLEGYDKEWIYTNASNRIASYGGLKPGNYKFMVKGSNCDGVWSENPTTIDVHILAPWWSTLWFKIIIVVSIFGLFYLFYTIRLTVYRKRQIELTQIVEARTFELEETNLLLTDRQKRIEEQSKELHIQTENLKETNGLLTTSKTLLEDQARKLEEANKKLLVLNSTKDRFFSIIAHDLRNPFHVVMGFSEILLRDYRKMQPEKMEKYLNLIYTASRTGNDLLENLLQWSRSQTGRIVYAPEKITLTTCVEEVLTLSEGSALRKNIVINQLVSSELLVMADENMLKTVLRNLISNAIKFTPEDGNITIDSRINGSMVEIEVRDTGIGISPENMDLLFRVDATFTTKGTNNESGTGLGLLLCKEFVEKQGGQIFAESQQGQGSRFVFTLPLA
jgi:signal transduction histidine kinase/ligand-binding sensor domain-containing protein